MRILFFEGIKEIGRIIKRAIVNHYNLKLRIGLLQNGIEVFLKVFRFVSGTDNHRHGLRLMLYLRLFVKGQFAEYDHNIQQLHKQSAAKGNDQCPLYVIEIEIHGNSLVLQFAKVGRHRFVKGSGLQRFKHGIVYKQNDFSACW